MRFLFSLSVILFIYNTGRCNDIDSNIVINNVVKKIEILYNTKLKRVEIVEKNSYIINTNKPNANFSFARFYDERSKIDQLTYVLDGKSSPFGFKPLDSFYQQNNVFHSDARIIFFNVNLPKINSKLNLRYRKIVDDPRYFSTVYFSEDYDIENKTIEITIPSWFNLEIKEFNFEGFNVLKTIDEQKDKKIITYKVTKLDALKNEEFSRGYSYTYPHILFLNKYADNVVKETYFIDLQHQYNWYRGLIRKDPDSIAIKEKALEIVQKAKTNEDKLKAIYYWIQDNIRYIAFEDGIAGFQPAYASDVLAKKYGDCKGMANLACQMLKSLGFDAKLAWLGTNHLVYDYSTPSLCVDNHMICAVFLEGKPVLIDPTETYLGMEENAQRIQNREILIENGEQYINYKNPEKTYTQNAFYISKELSMEDADLTGSIHYLLKGESKADFLSSYNQIKINHSEQALLNYLANGDMNYQIGLTDKPELKNYDKDIEIKGNLKQKNSVLKFSDEYYIDLDHDKEFKTMKFSNEKRHSDVFFPYKFNIKHQVKLKLPVGFKLKSKPTDLYIDNKKYRFKAMYEQGGGYVLYNKELIIKDTHLEKAEIEQLNNDLKALSNFYKESIILTKQ